jgi:hypothetical protein
VPANRRRRRAQAARARHAMTKHHPELRPPVRLGLAAAGVLCMMTGVVVLVTPHGAHLARGFSFLIVLGGALIAAACLA